MQIPRQILEKLNFDNNKFLHRQLKDLCKKFCCTTDEIYQQLREYGINYHQGKRQESGPQISVMNNQFERLLVENNIKYSVEFPLNGYYYDFKVGNILIEVNPTWTHNSTYNVTINGKQVNKLDKYYHYNKTVNALNYNYICLQVFDWVDLNNVINLLKMKDVKITQEYSGIQEHKVKLESSGKYKSYILNGDKILQEAEVSVFDDGHNIYI